MKKKKTLNYLLFITLLITPIIVNAANEETVKEYIICGNDKRFPTVVGTLISTLYVIIKILVPLLLVIAGIISFLKVTFSSNVEEELNKAKKGLINKIAAAVIIYFIISILNFVIALVAGANNNFASCINCMIHPDKCETANGDIPQLCPGLLSEQEYYDENCKYIGPEKNTTDYSTGDTGIQDTQSTTSTTPTTNRNIVDNPNALTNQNIVTKSDEGSGYSYYLYVPKKIDNPESLPLIVYLHGNGTECGYGYDLMKKGFGFAKYIEQGMEFNAYIVMPQKHDKSAWNTDAIKRIIDQEVETNKIDKNRISIWGYSAGAETVPSLVNKYPKMFSSAVILAKKWDTTIDGFKTVPTYGFYGTADNYSNSKNDPNLGTPHFIEKLQKAGYTAYIKAYEGIDHDHVMEQLMADNNIGNGFNTIMNWVLDQKRSD